MVKHRFERWTIQQRTSLYNHYFTSESILYERLKETKRYQRENKDCQWLFPDKFVGIDQKGGLKPRANFPVRCQSNNPVTCIFLVIGWWGCAAGWGYILIIMELRFNRAIRTRLHIFGIKKLWYKGIWKWEDSFLPNVTKMRPINGQRIDYYWVSVLRSKRPSKNLSEYLLPPLRLSNIRLTYDSKSALFIIQRSPENEMWLRTTRNTMVPCEARR